MSPFVPWTERGVISQSPGQFLPRCDFCIVFEEKFLLPRVGFESRA